MRVAKYYGAFIALGLMLTVISMISFFTIQVSSAYPNGSCESGGGHAYAFSYPCPLPPWELGLVYLVTGLILTAVGILLRKRAPRYKPLDGILQKGLHITQMLALSDDPFFYQKSFTGERIVHIVNRVS